MNNWFLLIPALTAITGMICVRLPLLLLFHPLTPRGFPGARFQGLVPSMKAKIAAGLGRFAASQFPLEILEEKINDPANFEKIRPMIEVHIDEFLRVKLKEQMPMISMFIGDKTIVSLKEVFINEIAELFPRIMSQFSGDLRAGINLESTIEAKINAADLPRLAASFRAITRKPLKKLSALGFVLGLLIGVIQLVILYQL